MKPYRCLRLLLLFFVKDIKKGIVLRLRELMRQYRDKNSDHKDSGAPTTSTDCCPLPRTASVSNLYGRREHIFLRRGSHYKPMGW